MLIPGQMLGENYQVIASLGAGGQGAAYLVEDTALARQCVAKAALVPDPADLEELETEARTLAGLRHHPNLPVVHALIRHGGYPYFIMEYINGSDIRTRAERRTTPFDVQDVLNWALGLLNALDHIHNQDPPLYHRDVKPSNVCITPQDRAVLLDFGIARRGDASGTRPAAQLQSLGYSPIEQYLSCLPDNFPEIRNKMEELKAAGIHTGPYSDLYSLAATLYFALTLQDPPDACLRIINDELRPVQELNPAVPDALATALQHALVVDPLQRSQTVEEIFALLQPVLPGGGPVAGSMQRRKGEKTMYTAQISRANPTCFLFLIDQSWSMKQPLGGQTASSKAEMLAGTINKLLQNLVGRCTKGEGIRRYFQVSVIGYGQTVGPALGGDLVDKDLVWIDEIAQNARIEEHMRKEYDGVGGLVEVPIRVPIWFDPVANNGTPMCRALWQAHALLEDWVLQHPTAFPPVVINITDGESTDGDPAEAAAAIRQLATEDGRLLLLNLHLSSFAAQPIHFPDNDQGLPDQHALRLYQMSSPLTEGMRATASEFGYPVTAGSRGFVFNAGIEDVIQFLNIGTMPANR